MSKIRQKIKQSDHIMMLKVKTESNSFGALKTIIVLLCKKANRSFFTGTFSSFFKLAQDANSNADKTAAPKYIIGCEM